MGGTSDDAGLGSTAVDASGNVFVVGGFGNTNGDTISFGAGITLTNLGGGVPGAGMGDAFLAKYDSAGAIQWAKRAGTTNMDGYLGVSTDAQGNIYADGGFGGTGFIGGFNAVVTNMIPTGSRNGRSPPPEPTGRWPGPDHRWMRAATATSPAGLKPTSSSATTP